MNEPANLEDMPDKGLPPDVVHRADDDLGGPGPHAPVPQHLRRCR